MKEGKTSSSGAGRWKMLVGLIAGVVVIAFSSIAPSPVHAAGTVWGWGYNGYGQLGTGTNTDSNVPVAVSNLSGVVAVAAGNWHSVAVKSDGTVWTWGGNAYGQLGNGSTTFSNVPVAVSNLTGAIAVAGGANHSLTAKSDGTVWAWGANYYGQLGNGINTSSNVPVQVSNLTGVVAVAGGMFHSLAVKSDGTVWAWGKNYYGELGNGSATDSNVPVQVSNLSGVVAIAGGGEHSLALKSDESVWAWGNNYYGALGNGSNTDSNVPVQVSNMSGVIAVAAGITHNLAVKKDGTVWAWGWNPNGELGNGSSGYATNSNVPVQVSNLTGATAVAAGYYHSLALKSNGTVWAWGWNYYGALGNGSSGNAATSSNVPVAVSYLTGATAVAAGSDHSLAIAECATCPTTAGPTVTGVNPNFGLNNASVNITNLAGTAFLSGATVKLTKSGQSDITATNVVVASSPMGETSITCTFDLNGKATGEWNVVVTNPDSQSGTLTNGFTINQAAFHDVALTAFSASPNPVEQGRKTTFAYQVKNLGTYTESGMRFRLYLDGHPIGKNVKLSPLEAGQSLSGSLAQQVGMGQKPDDYLIEGRVSTVPDETNTENNKATVKVTVVKRSR